MSVPLNNLLWLELFWLIVKFLYKFYHNQENNKSSKQWLQQTFFDKKKKCMKYFYIN